MPSSQSDSSGFQYIVFRDIKNDHIADILEETYLKQVYLPYVMGKKDLIIVDVGQNIGLTSYYFKDYAKRVIGLEPAAMHRETSSKMFALNGITNIETLPYALSGEKGKLKLFHNPNTTAFTLDTRAQNDTGFEEVDVITTKDLFTIAKIDHIDICKLDPEGAESKIIASDEFEELAPKIHVVLGEYHDWTDMGKDAFANRFRDLGYEFTWDKTTKASVYTAVHV